MTKNVEALASLLNQPVETVQTALEADGGLVDRIIAFKKDHTILKQQDKETLIKNAKEDGKAELLADFKPELLDKKQINRLVAWKLEEIETDLKDRYKFDGQFRGTIDLVDQIVKTKSGNNNADPKYEEEITKLKQRITEISQEKDEALESARQETDRYIVTTEFDRSISGLPLDYEHDAVEKQRRLLRDSFNGSYDVKRKDGKLMVYKKGSDSPLQDEKLDPLPIDTVVINHAKEFGFKLKSPGKGGQGGSSSSNTGGKFGGMSERDFMAYLEKNNIHKLSAEADSLRKQWATDNKT